VAVSFIGEGNWSKVLESLSKVVTVGYLLGKLNTKKRAYIN
jgi:hypothetical protein